MLELQKKTGGNFKFHYIFDAKYRIDQSGKETGPMEEDINTMHRYRDAIVYSKKDDEERYVQTVVGAYILFPYDKEESQYEKHRFYRSIGAINIGGIPFLPNKTRLLERVIDTLFGDPENYVRKHIILPSILSGQLFIDQIDKSR